MVLSDQSLGNAIVAYHVQHWDELGVDYIIWWQQIWSADRADEGWRDYTRGTDITTRHQDHLHVTLADSGGGA